MIVCRLHLPTHDNDKNNLLYMHLALEDALGAAFGGFTSWEAYGHWRGDDGRAYNEPVRVYEVAMDKTAVADFENTAKLYGRMAGQRAVFLIVDGCASIINLGEKE